MKKKNIVWVIIICLIMICVIVSAILIANMSRKSHVCNHENVIEAEKCEDYNYCLDCGEKLSMKEHACVANGFACTECHKVFKTVSVKVEGINKPTIFTDTTQDTSRFPEFIIDNLSIKEIITSFDGKEFSVEFDIDLSTHQGGALETLCGDYIIKYLSLGYKWYIEEIDGAYGIGSTNSVKMFIVDSERVRCHASIPADKMNDKFNVTIELTPHIDNSSWYKTCNHGYNVVSEIAASNNSNGCRVLQCAICGYKTTTIIPKLVKPTPATCVHSFRITDKLDATCMDSGYETRVCTKCGYSETATTERMSCITQGHVHTEHKDATCCEYGYHKVICDICGRELQTSDLGSQIAMVAHDFRSSGKGDNQAYTCCNCGMEIKAPFTTIGDYPMSIGKESGATNSHDYAVFHYMGKTERDGKTFYYGMADMVILEADSLTASSIEFGLPGINPEEVSSIYQSFTRSESRIEFFIVFPESWASGALQMDVPFITF